jgi:hypothetical protein
MAAVAGIDTDANGIRDDIDRFIATRYGPSASAVAAARRSARARQRVLTTNLAIPSAARTALQDSGDAGVCSGQAFELAGFDASAELNELYLRTHNTLERLAQYKAVAASAGQFTRSVTSVVCQ